jgi:hypothetical protein
MLLFAVFAGLVSAACDLNRALTHCLQADRVPVHRRASTAPIAPPMLARSPICSSRLLVLPAFCPSPPPCRRKAPRARRPERRRSAMRLSRAVVATTLAVAIRNQPCVECVWTTALCGQVRVRRSRRGLEQFDLFGVHVCLCFCCWFRFSLSLSLSFAQRHNSGQHRHFCSGAVASNNVSVHCHGPRFDLNRNFEIEKKGKTLKVQCKGAVTVAAEPGRSCPLRTRRAKR